MIDYKKLSDLNANFNEGQIYSHSELRVFFESNKTNICSFLCYTC